MSLRAPGPSRRGFSLVELLVVTAIMLLLAALAMPRLLDAQRSANQAGVVSLLRTLQTDQESYRLANGIYADNFTDLGLAARGPVAPGDPFAPGSSPQLAALLPQLASFQVFAAASDQQAPPQTPPPPPPADQSFGGKSKKNPAKSIGGPGGMGGSGPGGGAGGQPGASGGSAGGAPKRGGGGKRPSSGGALGGATGGGSPSQSGAGAPASGSGGSFAPSPAPVTKSNILLKHTYIFTLLRPTLTTWTCTAAPIRDRGDSKFFFLDQTGVMRAELGKPASANSPQM